MERATGIEPAQSVWKTETLPLSYARTAPFARVARISLPEPRRSGRWVTPGGAVWPGTRSSGRCGDAPGDRVDGARWSEGCPPGIPAGTGWVGRHRLSRT